MKKQDFEVKIKIDDKKVIQKHLQRLGGTIEELKFQTDTIDERTIEKYHQLWIFEKNNLHVVIESVPFGDYLYIKGARKTIENFIKNLQFDIIEYISKDYLDEYSNYCNKNCIKEKMNITFKNYR